MREFRPFQVRLPSGDRHWTVVDSAYRPVREADEWLLHVRLGRDCAESTTEAYARSLGLLLDWCAVTGLDWRRAPGQLGRFMYWVQRYDPDVPAVGQVRGDRAGLRLRSKPRHRLSEPERIIGNYPAGQEPATRRRPAPTALPPSPRRHARRRIRSHRLRRRRQGQGAPVVHPPAQ